MDPAHNGLIDTLAGSAYVPIWAVGKWGSQWCGVGAVAALIGLVVELLEPFGDLRARADAVSGQRLDGELVIEGPRGMHRLSAHM